MSSREPDRRRRRHRETADEIVGHALAMMGETGAAGLSLGEVARRMEMRTPSLYVYFPSKAALYDEVFARGWRSFGEALREYDAPVPDGASLELWLASAMGQALRWASDHPAYSQLMFWRPVPAWQPSPESYAAAQDVSSQITRAVRRLHETGRLREDADVAEVVDFAMVLVAGLISQRLSNEPSLPLESGRVAALVDPLVSAFIAHYGSRSRS